MEENASKEPLIVYQNSARIRGRILEEPNYTNEAGGIRFYETRLSVYRLSSKSDTIPITLPEPLYRPDMEYTDRVCEVRGNFRSYNRYEDERVHLKLSVFAREIVFPKKKSQTYGAHGVVRERSPWESGSEDVNEVVLEGFICRPPAYRRTPMGREITDFLLGVPRIYSRSDFIPCIAWGYNAKIVRKLVPGTRVLVKGRIQSRIYIKEVAGGNKDLRQAFELSVFELYVFPAGGDKQTENLKICETKFPE